ncbi:MAG: hypothetical protein V7K27_04445 [Nostoc sp.]|uniref:hypothetical protein n=1 Tax=Nostoc sp. TaxID=1180 RepID=UPI002FFB07FE
MNSVRVDDEYWLKPRPKSSEKNQNILALKLYPFISRVFKIGEFCIPTPVLYYDFSSYPKNIDPPSVTAGLSTP